MNNNIAVFLDRDGVINYPVLNLKTKEHEAPQKEEDLKLFPGVIDSLKKLIRLDYNLFIVSNQPDYAKGKTSLENLHMVHKKLHSIFLENDIKFLDYYYCYHHPKGIVKEYSIKCDCRKPGNLFLEQAKEKYGLEMSASWMIGDRDVDIYCGQLSRTKTIMINSEYTAHNKESNPDYKVNDLSEAVSVIERSR